jgi:glycosyltransferase involved in cell wall biosynthesis
MGQFRVNNDIQSHRAAAGALQVVESPAPSIAGVTILTGGQDKSYATGLVGALSSRVRKLDVIGSDEVDCADIRALDNVSFLNLRGSQRSGVGFGAKMWRIFRYYARLVRYAAGAKPGIFHILWNNKFEWLDRTGLMLYYKLLGKKVVLTAHNINTRRRDGSDTFFNRLTLRCQYHLCDHIFVHTEKMKSELLAEFGVKEGLVTVIPFGINSTVPSTELTREQARARLGVSEGEKAVLFFGRIAPYKGLEFLVAAFQRITDKHPDYRLIIAGSPKPGADTYSDQIRQTIDKGPGGDRIIRHLRYIPDEDTELYFKGADVLALPYRDISQTGVLFLAYNFGLPAIATDVGAFRDDIVRGETGFLCQPCDSAGLAETIEEYFASDLFQELEGRRTQIREYAAGRHSWETVGEMTSEVYGALAGVRDLI